MARRSCVVAICIVLLAFGCKKKQQEPAEQPRPEPPAIVAPLGFAHIPGTMPPVFISEKPVTVGQYRLFCEETGEPATAVAEAAEDDAPVSGLSLAQARRYAVWQLARLPTAEEWRLAAAIVGTAPYPWAEEPGEQEVREGARLFLVREWTEGSPAQEAARQRREALAREILTARAEEVAALSARWRRAWRPNGARSSRRSSRASASSGSSPNRPRSARG